MYMQKKKHLQKRKACKVRGGSEGVSGTKKILLCSIFGAVAGLVSMLALILIFSAAALSFEYPHEFLTPLSLFSLWAAAFIGGLLATRKNGGTALLCGALNAVLMLLSLKLILMILPLSNSGAAPTLTPKLLSLGAIPFSALGAFLGIPQSKKKSKHRM